MRSFMRRSTDPRGAGFAVGVPIIADEPASLAFVVGADVSSTNHEWPAGVADCRQRIDDPVCSSSSEISAIFKSEPTRSAFVDDADGFEVEAGALSVDAFAFCVGAANVLARRAADDDIGKSDTIPNKSVCCECSDVVINRNSRIVLGIEGAPPVDDFASGNGAIAGAMHAK
uniref:Uncharacterized protein n=1 Tax=Rhizobium leguminosarum TaxID=384 RepID=A0A179BTV8_RHILE|nr:hypothetical protein A4U53_18035 [Rhizobium leguminosarum]